MPEPKEIAIAALKKMLAKVGPDAEFPGDAIWDYADEKVEALRKPPVFKTLSSEGYIENTGETVNASTPERRSAPTTKYRFGPLLRPQPAAGAAKPSEIASAFSTACHGVLQVQDSASIRFVASLLAKRFLILTGLAGSGKTKLAQAFARWISPEGAASQSYSLVPVGADWLGNENILGYPDGLDRTRYLTRPALDLILSARTNADTPHFLILDEMNLSHVERYFADILSIMESGEKIQLYGDGARKAGANDLPAAIELPRNLFVIGTVNVDETTYMFSPKVLDRANVIEFRMATAEMASFLANPVNPDLAKLDGKGASFAKMFVETARSVAAVPAGVRAEHAAEMLLFFDALQAHGSEFGYRVAHEAARFVNFYKLVGGYSDDDAAWFASAFDCVVFQKLLPKLHGSRMRLGPLLRDLWVLCVTPASARGSNAGEAGADAALAKGGTVPSTKVPPGAPYPMSAEKIGRMWRLLNENGFASFAEA